MRTRGYLVLLLLAAPSSYQKDTLISPTSSPLTPSGCFSFTQYLKQIILRLNA